MLKQNIDFLDFIHHEIKDLIIITNNIESYLLTNEAVLQIVSLNNILIKYNDKSFAHDLSTLNYKSLINLLTTFETNYIVVIGLYNLKDNIIVELLEYTKNLKLLILEEYLPKHSFGIRTLNYTKSMPVLNCVIMASGFSKRFEDNKLLAQINGSSLFEMTLKQVPIELFNEVVIITRYPEIAEIAEKYQVKTIIHNKMKNSDTLKLGLENLGKSDGTMFITSDQPLRLKASLIRMIDKFKEGHDKVIRLKYEDEVSNPIIFTKNYYEKINSLENESTARELIKGKSIEYVEALNKLELFDVDTKSDYEELLRIISKEEI